MRIPVQDLLHGILNSQPDLVVLALDRDYRYLAFNENHRQTMARIWGVDITVGVSMLEQVGRDDDRDRAKKNFDRALAGESFTLTEAYGDATAGQRRFYRDAYAPIMDGDAVVGLTVFLTDVTEQRNTEIALESLQRDLEDLVAKRTAEMLHSQKLESLGVLAGGIAHDFNNILAVIMGAADLAAMHSGEEAALMEEIARIQRGAERAAELTDQMLSYAGQGERHVEPISLPALITDMLDLLGSTLTRRARFTIDLGEDTPMVMGDAGQLKQVVMNLITNASDAVADGGSVGVTLGPDETDEGSWAMLEVEDNGCGMDRDTLHRIFDPFFTTKFKGRGLGLAAVQGIIASHGGQLEVESDRGEGSIFRVRLPAIGADDPSLLAGPVPNRPERLPAHVLVVDDEPEVRQVCERMLTAHGVACTLAVDGNDAIDAFQRNPSVDVVLLDLTMPGPSPEDVIVGLRSIRPDVPIVVFSGFDEHDARLSVGDRIQGFFRKPFSVETLLAMLAQVTQPQPTR